MEADCSTPIVKKRAPQVSGKADDCSSVTSGYSTCTDTSGGRDNSLRFNTNGQDDSLELIECYSSTTEEENDDYIVDDKILSSQPVLMRKNPADDQCKISNSKDGEIVESDGYEIFNELFSEENMEIVKCEVSEVFNGKENAIFNSKENSNSQDSFNSEENDIFDNKDNSNSKGNCLDSKNNGVFNDLNDGVSNNLDNQTSNSGNNGIPNNKIDLIALLTKDDDWLESIVEKPIGTAQCSPPTVLHETAYSNASATNTETDSGFFQNLAQCSTYYPDFSDMCSETYSFWELPNEVTTIQQHGHNFNNRAHFTDDTTYQCNYPASNYAVQTTDIASWPSFTSPNNSAVGHATQYALTSHSETADTSGVVYSNSSAGSDAPLPSISSAFSLPSFPSRVHDWNYDQCDDLGVSAEYSDIEDDTWPSSDEHSEPVPISSQGNVTSSTNCVHSSNSIQTLPSYVVQNVPIHSTIYVQNLDIQNGSASSSVHQAEERKREFAPAATPVSKVADGAASKQSATNNVVPQKRVLLLLDNNALPQLRLCDNSMTPAPMQLLVNNNNSGSQSCISVADHNSGTLPPKNGSVSSCSTPAESNSNLVVDIADSDGDSVGDSEPNESSATTSHVLLDDPTKIFSSNPTVSASNQSEKGKTSGTFTTLHWMPAPVSVIPISQPVFPLTSPFVSASANKKGANDVSSTTLSSATTNSAQHMNRGVLRTATYHHVTPLTFRTHDAPPPYIAIVKKSAVNTTMCHKQQQRRKTVRELLQDKYQQMIINKLSQQGVLSRVSLSPAATVFRAYKNDDGERKPSSVLRPRVVQLLPPNSSVTVVGNPKNTPNSGPQSLVTSASEMELARAVCTLPLVATSSADESVDTPQDSSTDVGSSNSSFLVTTDKEEVNPPDMTPDDPIADKSVVCELLELPPFKKGRVDAKEHRPRHYDLIHLQIGEFSITTSKDHSLKTHNKFKVLFTKRQFTYEFSILSCSPVYDVTGRLQVACVVVPFKIVSAMKCDNNVVNIRVDCQPSIYLGYRHPRIGIIANATVYDTSKMVDITNGEIGRCHIHKIVLKKHQANKLKMYLWHFDPRFKVLTRINVDDSVDYPLVPQLPSPDDLDKETMRRFQRKVTKSGIRRLPQWEAEQGLPTTSQVCSCRISCRSVRCSCVKAAQKCSHGRSVCLCSNCDNPLNILDSLGINPRLAVMDDCLFQNVYQITDLRSYLYREVKLECCNSYIAIKDCIPNAVHCPNSLCLSTTQYEYSWCDETLCNASTSPRNHCSLCGRCCFFTARHCAQCNKCYKVTKDILICPKCKVAEDLDEYSTLSVLSPNSPDSLDSASEMNILNHTRSRNAVEEIVIEN